MYSIDSTMSFGQAICYYETYLEDMKKQNKKPVSFLRFVTGRY